MTVEIDEDELYMNEYNQPTLQPRQQLRLSALSLAVAHHQHDALRKGLNPRNQVKAVFQTADFFFEYVKSGAHVDPPAEQVVDQTHQTELFVAQ